MKKITKEKKKGFTLIELIAVIAILAVLAAVAIPNVITYVNKSKRTAIKTEATTVYNAAAAAYNDGNQALSSTKSFENITVSEVVSAQASNGQSILSNGQSAITMFTGSTTMGQLQKVMDEPESNITYTDNNGQLVMSNIPSASSSISK